MSRAGTKRGIAQFDLSFYNGRHRLRVFIHPSLASLHKAWRALGDPRPARGTRAFWTAAKNYTLNSTTGAILQKYLGRIHLCEGHIGGGVWAHELQHFVSNWLAVKSWGLEDPHFEKIADIVYELTAKFWARYFELHPEYQPLPGAKPA